MITDELKIKFDPKIEFVIFSLQKLNCLSKDTPLWSGVLVQWEQ